MEKRKIRVGDRYNWYNYGNAMFADTIEYLGDKWLIVEGNDAGTIYPAEPMVVDNICWKFIGNFGKQDNFIELYNLMNENN